MEENPFAKIIQVIRQEYDELSRAPYRIGRVVRTDPLRILVAGLEREASDFEKNAALDFFEVGDRVLLLPDEDEQSYIILCKVVSA